MLRRFSDEMRDLAAAETPADGVALLECFFFFFLGNGIKR
jgi:hypothetical protein